MYFEVTASVLFLLSKVDLLIILSDRQPRPVRRGEASVGGVVPVVGGPARVPGVQQVGLVVSAPESFHVNCVFPAHEAISHTWQDKF